MTRESNVLTFFMGSGSASLGSHSETPLPGWDPVGLMGPIREGESPAEWAGGDLNEAEQFSPAVVGTVLGMDAGSSFGRYEGLCFPVAQQLLLLHNNCASKPSRV